ncbi:biotin/lipoyl-containing protein [Thermodesulfobacteriota bacterium]
MEYRLKTGDEVIPVDVEKIRDGTLKARVNGSMKEVHYRPVSDHQIHLSVDGRSFNAYVADTEDGKTIFINGESHLVRDADELEQKAARKASPRSMPQEVTPPMPAIVVRVLVSEGDRVEEGQGLVVVSAMKMETTLKAPYSGNVSGINCSEGDKVSPGIILVDIEKESSA